MSLRIFWIVKGLLKNVFFSNIILLDVSKILLSFHVFVYSLLGKIIVI